MTALEALREWRGKTVFFEPVGGNLGDVLIEMGTRHACRQMDVHLDDHLDGAERILINGNASLGVGLYDKFAQLENYARKFSDTPMVLLPSSYDFQDNRVGEFFEARRAPTWLFAREKYSLRKLQTQTFPSNVQVELDHDMAFHLRDSEFVRELRTRSRAEHVLLVERFDLETATGAKPQYIPISLKIKNLLPPPIAAGLRRWLHKRRTAQTNFAATALARVYAENAEWKRLPVLARDISAPGAFTFETFTQAIAHAAVVVTTRLHVGILAALLDKPTYLYTGSAPYPKIKSIYEYSMADMKHVHLWETQTA